MFWGSSFLPDALPLPLPCLGTMQTPNLPTAANPHCLYRKQQARNPSLFSFSLNMTNVKEKMRNYFGLKFRTDNSKCGQF